MKRAGLCATLALLSACGQNEPVRQIETARLDRIGYTVRATALAIDDSASRVEADLALSQAESSPGTAPEGFGFARISSQLCTTKRQACQKGVFAASEVCEKHGYDKDDVRVVTVSEFSSELHFEGDASEKCGEGFVFSPGTRLQSLGRTLKTVGKQRVYTESLNFEKSDVADRRKGGVRFTKESNNGFALEILGQLTQFTNEDNKVYASMEVVGQGAVRLNHLARAGRQASAFSVSVSEKEGPDLALTQTYEGLTWRADCCYPVAGTVEVKADSPALRGEGRFEFSDRCGEGTLTFGKAPARRLQFVDCQ